MDESKTRIAERISPPIDVYRLTCFICLNELGNRPRVQLYPERAEPQRGALFSTPL